MSSPRYYQASSGVPFTVTRVYADACCDCGLVHHNRVRVLDAQGRVIRGATVEITTARAPRLTHLERQRLRKLKNKGERV